MKFDLSKIEASNNDKLKNIKLPDHATEKLAEFIGILAGDGYLYRGSNSYTMGIVGHPIKDYEFFKYVQYLILELFNKPTKVKERQRAIRIVFQSKWVSEFLIKIIKMPYGNKKCFQVCVPEFVRQDNALSRSFLRGLFDTDGSVFVSDKRGSPNYPTIELSTTSSAMINQVHKILQRLGFRVTNIRSNLRYPNPNFIYIVSLNGNKNMQMWYDQIGFSNPSKKKVLLKILKNGDAGI
tara:strand:+ start:9374 stop:10087 length:714 start_codon:yes stop_codon:yes gene_type:complete